MPRKRDLLTVDECAELAGVSRKTILSWHHSKKLVMAFAEKNRPLFTKGALMALVTGNCEYCGVGFKRADLRQRFCGVSCRQKASRLPAPDDAEPSPEMQERLGHMAEAAETAVEANLRLAEAEDVGADPAGEPPVLSMPVVEAEPEANRGSERPLTPEPEAETPSSGGDAPETKGPLTSTQKLDLYHKLIAEGLPAGEIKKRLAEAEGGEPEEGAEHGPY